MRKLAVLVPVILAMAFFSAPVAQAASLTDSQVSAIVGLLQSFGADSATITNVQAALTGTPAVTSTSCISLTNNLYAGQTDSAANGEVTKLQNFLGVSATGYFGPATLQAVQNWQSDHSVVSSGTADTTGYGFVGPATRRAMACSIVTTTTTTPTTTTVSATIDQSSLTTTSPNPTITGTVSGTPEICVAIGTNSSLVPQTYNTVASSVVFGMKFRGCANGGYNSAFSISNGHWSVNVPSLPAGQYGIGVYDGADTANAGNMLTKDTLTVNAATTSTASATIDQSSLTTTSGTPTITGTASSQVHSVLVSIVCNSAGSTNGCRVAQTVVPVVNGRWSAVLSPSYQLQGSYSVEVSGYSDTAGIQPILQGGSSLIATGTLTVNPAVAGGLTPAQISSVIQLLTSFSASQTVITNVQFALNGGGITAPATQNSYLTASQQSAVLNLINAFGATSSVVQNVTNALLGAPNVASATIDQSSLTTTSGTPTITGTATVAQVYVNVSGNGKAGASQGVVTVTNGHWSAIVYPKTENTFPAGTYTVSIYNGLNGPVLATGTLTVNAVTTSTATSLALSGSTSTSNSTVVAGTTGAPVGTVYITAGNTQGVSVNKLNVQFAQGTVADIASLSLVYGASATSVSSAVSSGGTTFVFSSPIQIAAGQTVALALKADVTQISSIGGMAKAGDVIQFAVSGAQGYGVATGETVTSTSSVTLPAYTITSSTPCAVGNVYATQVPGYVYSNVYIAVHGLSVSPSDIIGITGADSWNSLQFMYDSTETGNTGATILKATQTVNATGVSYIMARSGDIAPATKNGTSITCSPSYKG